VYGFFPENETVEIVNLRLRASGRVRKPRFEPQPSGDGDGFAAADHARIGVREIRFHPVPVFDGAALRPGDRITGPALITRSDTTIWLPEGSKGEMDRFLNLVVTV
jgi:N-methylhydantoinase A